MVDELGVESKKVGRSEDWERFEIDTFEESEDVITGRSSTMILLFELLSFEISWKEEEDDDDDDERDDKEEDDNDDDNED